MVTGKWTLVAAVTMFVTSAAVVLAQDTGYFLSMEQKGQLLWRGRIKDSDSIWYDI